MGSTLRAGQSRYFRGFAAVLAVAAASAAPAVGQIFHTTKPATGPVTVDQFIEALKKQAATFDTGAADFDLPRPHPLVDGLPAGCEAELAKHLNDKFTGDPQKDIYIRYHLIYPVIHPKATPVPGEVFVAFSKVLPDKIAFEQRPFRKFDPPDIGHRYWQLMQQASITTGYPPFQKQVWPPESLKLMDASARAKAEPLWEEAKSLKDKFKTIDDKDAVNYNLRVGKTPWMLRQVRGDALYGMLASGDPKMLAAVIRTIAQQAISEPTAASDSLAFLNQAYFDGWLSTYSPAILKQAAGELKRAVVAGDAAAGRPAPGRMSPKSRAPSPPQPVVQKNILQERAFTVITAMESGSVPKRASADELTRNSKTLPPLVRRNLTARTLDLKSVDDAIERAVIGLEKVRAPDVDLGPDSYWAADIAAWLQQWILPGNQALACWAFLSTGENQYTPWLAKRIGWVACYQSASTYDRAMRLRMLSMLPQKNWQPWMRRDADWLIQTMTPQGGFTPGVSTLPKPPGADNANSQYAVLGLAAAQDAGYDIDARVWRQIDKYWRDAQFPSGNADAGAWAVKPARDIQKGSDAFVDRASGPMTAGGVLTLSITERFLEGAKKLGTGNKTSPELAAGIEWLDKHFDLNQIDGDSDLYYYLWTIQNVGQAIGYRKFNNVDWFREATVTLLNQQGPDGLWKGPKGPTVSTSFALLYLYRARGPLAVCKVRFGDDKKNVAPAWNNRPNDLQNLTDDMSRRLEVPTSWQIADLDQPVNELIESATLYFVTDKSFTLKDEQIGHLRDYLNAGGMLVASPEGGGAASVLNSFRDLAAKLYPGRQFTKAEAAHPFFTLNQKVGEKIPVSILDNGIRPLIVLVEKDLSKDLQADNAGKRDSFNLLTNIYLYATGLAPKRPRMLTNYVVAPEAPAKATVTAARIKYDGNFDPEPASLSQLSALLAKKGGVDLKISTLAGADLTPATQVAFLTVTESAQLADADATALRKWIDAGGTLWIDAAGGRAAASAAVDSILAKLGYQPGDLKPCDDTPILTGKTRRPGGIDVSKPTYRNFVEGDRATLRQALSGSRPAVYVTRGDVAAALAGANTYGISGFGVDTVRGMVANSILNPQSK